MRRRPKTARKQLQLWPKPAPAPPPRESGPPVPWRGAAVHLIGIGGVGMSGIAALLPHYGCTVTGCDAGRSDIIESLTRRGIHVSIGHSPEHITEKLGLVIVSAAIRDTNPEVREAARRGIPVVKYAQALGWLMKDRDGIAVSGAHGKTTTTSMIAYALSYGGKHPAMVVGGVVPQLGGNSLSGRSGPFVVEACEYDRSFLNLSPKAVVVTNIDREHLDYYSGLEELVEAFGAFVALAPADGLCVANGDDPNVLRAVKRSRARVETFGDGKDCDWRVGEWSRAEGRTRFRAFHRGKNIGVFELLVPGYYNVRNALACIAASSFFDVNRQDVRESLAEFRGARRRFDRLGEAAGVMVLDDYGHHPTEVRVTLDAARQEFPMRRLLCVFQPHQCSRTRLLMNDFAGAFGSADCVIVPDIYSVRDNEADRASVHSQDLVATLRRNGVQAEYGSQFPETVDRLLHSVRSGDLVMTMGAGPVNDVGIRLLQELKKREQSDELVLRA
ncbi:MAG: UDP-N-acetylmuramate--L-alanine ligase [Candidatus Brocadiia bacterium]